LTQINRCVCEELFSKDIKMKTTEEIIEFKLKVPSRKAGLGLDEMKCVCLYITK
jgi:hypothetical protein